MNKQLKVAYGLVVLCAVLVAISILMSIKNIHQLKIRLCIRQSKGTFMKTNKKRQLTSAGKVTFYVLILSLFTVSVYLHFENQKTSSEIDRQLEKLQQGIQEQKSLVANTLAKFETSAYVAEIGSDAIETEVLFTNYGLWDGESINATASGLNVQDFELNKEGMYTYNNHVVLATANKTRWNRKLKRGYNTHELNEIIAFQLNGKNYTGIVLDVCGACQGVKSENKQRYDIFTVEDVIGKSKGVILE